MTIGIGALCQQGTTVVIASDMRSTYPKSSIDPNDLTGKQWDFDMPSPVIACAAGRLGLCQPVVDELNNRLKKLRFDKGVYCEHIENAINEARFRMFKRYGSWCLKMSYGMTLGQWQRGKVPGGAMSKIVHDEVRNFLGQLDFRVALIVAGFLPDGNLLFYKAEGKKHIEASTTPGVYVIGTGGQLAMQQLNKRGQNIGYGLPRTLLHISEAMDEAKKVPDRSVGEPQDFTIVWRDGRASRIRANSHLLRDWKKSYKDRESTDSLDSSIVAHKQISTLLIKHEIKRSTSQRSKQAK